MHRYTQVEDYLILHKVVSLDTLDKAQKGHGSISRAWSELLEELRQDLPWMIETAYPWKLLKQHVDKCIESNAGMAIACVVLRTFMFIRLNA